MLQKIEGEDAVLCVELRQQREPYPAPPVQEEEHGGGTPDGNLFEPALLRNGAMKTSLRLEIQLIILVPRKNNVPEE